MAIVSIGSHSGAWRQDAVRPFTHAEQGAATPHAQAAAPRAQVWGAFWTVPMPPATGAVRFCLNRSLIFTAPLLGCVELPLHELTQDNLCTQWHPLRAQGQRGEDILGEARRLIVSSGTVSRGTVGGDTVSK